MRALIKATTAAGAVVIGLCALAACSSASGAGSAATTSSVASVARTTKHARRDSNAEYRLRAQQLHMPVSRRDELREARAAQKRQALRPKNFCAHNSAAQKVIVRVSKQHAWMCAHHRDVFDTAVTTGMVGQWTHTPTGHYMIQGRNTNSVLTLNTGATYDVKYWIPFDAPLFGFHDASWQKFPFGSAKYKTKGSHGCVHMPLKAMKFLYNWAVRPTAVHIT